MKSYLLLVCLVLLAQTKLIYLAELFRHGARYPVSDIYDGKDTKANHGQLTSIGMRQQYLLGSYLKRDYIDQAQLFNATLDPKEVEIFTDSSERCYESAYAHAAGLFQIQQGEQIPQGISSELLQPPFEVSTPSHLQQEVVSFINGDFALTRGYQPVPIKEGKSSVFVDCPNEAALIAERVRLIATAAAQMQLEQAVFSQRIGAMFGLPVTLYNIAGMIELYDVVACDLNLGRAMPSKFTDKEFQEMKYIQNYMFVLLFAQHLAKVFSTPFAGPIIDNMEKAITGKLDGKKISIYSGHDTNIAPMLTFLNLTSAECLKRKFKNDTVVGNCAEPVPFASSIQYQLHQREGEDFNAAGYFVKIKYNGYYYLLCESKSTQCEFSEFATRVRRQLIDYKKQCGVK